MIDQSPIGRSPRSNPVTYVKAFDEIRAIFADTPLARQRKYTPGTFSFNVEGGRCEECEGAGCARSRDGLHGRRLRAVRRLRRQTLQARSARRAQCTERTSHDVLELTVDQAIRFFPREEKLGQALWQLQQVGLGYLRLGQPATTLSGGEAQRIKIARELALAGKKSGRKLYIMDEPTTGLHLDDIRKLAKVLDRLVEQGTRCVLIEHNLDVIKLADWVIDLGPGRRRRRRTSSSRWAGPRKIVEVDGVAYRAVARADTAKQSPVAAENRRIAELDCISTMHEPISARQLALSRSLSARSPC